MNVGNGHRPFRRKHPEKGSAPAKWDMFPIYTVGAGLPDGPPKICDFRDFRPLGRWDVEDAVPYVCLNSAG